MPKRNHGSVLVSLVNCHRIQPHDFRARAESSWGNQMKNRVSISIPTWVVLVVGAIVLVAAASTITFFVVKSSGGTSATSSVRQTQNATLKPQVSKTDSEVGLLSKLQSKSVCGAAFNYPNVTFALSSDGKSATLQSPDGWQVKCIGYQLGAPSSMYDRVLATRPIDGMQTQTWGNWTATWTYHPDQGVTFILQHN